MYGVLLHDLGGYVEHSGGPVIVPIRKDRVATTPSWMLEKVAVVVQYGRLQR